MKMKNLTALALTAVLCMGLILTGCSGKEEEPEETEPEEPAMQEIGDPSASLETELTNKLGGTVTGLSVKKPKKAAYPANMMLTDQQIAEDETVKFFYDPEASAETTVVITEGTTDDSEKAEESDADAAILPDAEAIGYWNMAGDTEEELTVWDITDDVVTFRLWWKDKTKTRDLMVSLNAGNDGTFAGVIGEDSMISGTMTFTETAITLTIEQCTYEGLELGGGPFVFDEKHAQSWEYADAYKANAETDAAAEDAAAETENTKDSYMLQVTMADDKTYELSAFDIADMDAADLCLEDEVAYLTYESLSSGTEISTRELEESIKKEKDAASPVVDEINAIGAADEENKEAVQAAREAYNALTEAEQAYVTNEAALRWKEISLETEAEEESEPDDTTYEEEDDEDTDEEDFDYGADDYEPYQDDERDEPEQEGASERESGEDWSDRYNDFGNDRREDRDRWGGGWN